MAKKYIELEAAKEAARKAECDANYDGAKFTVEWVENALDFIPTADVAEVRHGQWLIKTIRGDKRTVCSECLSETGTCYEENYCPNCGAKMDESEGEE